MVMKHRQGDHDQRGWISGRRQGKDDWYERSDVVGKHRRVNAAIVFVGTDSDGMCPEVRFFFKSSAH